MRIARANAIPETAFVISLALTVLYGALQMALVGFNQISADGATFVGDHAAVAYYNAPTSSDSTYAQQVGQSVFTHANGAYSATARNGTYEVDYNASQKTLMSFFPSSLTTTSRIIEPSQSTSSASLPLGNCAVGKLNIAPSGTINSASGSPVGLLQPLTATGLFKVAGDANGNNAVSLNATVIASQISTLTSIKTQLQAVQSDISALAGPLDLTSGTLGTLLGALGLANVNAVVSGDVTSQLGLALNGTLTTSNLQTSAGMTTQVSTALGPLLGGFTTPVMTAISSATAGSPFSATGLFGSSGPLISLSGLMAQLKAIDSLAPVTCS